MPVAVSLSPISNPALLGAQRGCRASKWNHRHWRLWRRPRGTFDQLYSPSGRCADSKHCVKCDEQRVHSQLEQHQRGNRLPAGRVLEQQLQQLASPQVVPHQPVSRFTSRPRAAARKHARERELGGQAQRCEIRQRLLHARATGLSSSMIMACNRSIWKARGNALRSRLARHGNDAQSLVRFTAMDDAGSLAGGQRGVGKHHVVASRACGCEIVAESPAE